MPMLFRKHIENTTETNVMQVHANILKKNCLEIKFFFAYFLFLTVYFYKKIL